MSFTVCFYNFLMYLWTSTFVPTLTETLISTWLCKIYVSLHLVVSVFWQGLCTSPVPALTVFILSDANIVSERIG